MSDGNLDSISVAEMRALEQEAIASGRATGLDLMERAGQGVVDAIFEHWPMLGSQPHHAVVLCGPGNNGGDGYVIARLLKEKGWQVEAFAIGDPAKLPPDARANYERWAAIEPTPPLNDFLDRENWVCEVIVDALFGTGLQRPIEGEKMWSLLSKMTEASDILSDNLNDFQQTAREFPPPKVVAVDIPSGVNADTGEIVGELLTDHGCRAARAVLTVTFHCKKHGHLLEDGPRLCGITVVKDIGL